MESVARDVTRVFGRKKDGAGRDFDRLAGSTHGWRIDSLDVLFREGRRDQGSVDWAGCNSCRLGELVKCQESVTNS